MADRNINTHTEATIENLWCPYREAYTPSQGNKTCIASICAMWKWSTNPASSEENIKAERRRADNAVKETEALRDDAAVKEAAIDKIKEDFEKYKKDNQAEGYCGLTR